MGERPWYIFDNLVLLFKLKVKPVQKLSFNNPNFPSPAEPLPDWRRRLRRAPRLGGARADKEVAGGQGARFIFNKWP